jgi:hypothetical protein
MDVLRIFDYLSVAALVFMSYGIFRQWYRIHTTNSVHDIELQEVLIRCVITYILLIKMFLVGDIYLIIGQCIFAVAILIYFITVLKLKLKNKKSQDRVSGPDS